MNQYQLVPNKHVAQQSTVDYFRAVQGPLRAINDGVLGKSASSLGQVAMNTVPFAVASNMMKRNGSARAAAGLSGGFGSGDMGMLAIAAVTYIAVTGALSYQAGKAMSPNSKDRSTWGWLGVPIGIFTGPWGLGVMGIVSNSRKS